MMLEELYLNAYDKFGKKRFGIEEFARLGNLTIQSSKVLIHRMNKNKQLLRVEHGKYILMKPENFLKLKQLRKKNKKLYALALELFGIFPELSVLVLYGSRVRGDADKYSDYDVLLILPEKRVETSVIKEKIEKKLNITLHLTIYSEKGYETAILSEPYIRFWLAEGIMFDETAIMQKPVPPISKMAYMEWWFSAETYVKTANETKKTEYYFTALEILELINAALKMEYDFKPVKSEIKRLVGERIIKKIRIGKKLDKKESKLLEKVCKKELKSVNNFLCKIGKNEVDLYWEEKIIGG
ncbi:nucleotidyltransferase domain-containing protein [Candidatus Micrarchaeota archaeon]|nr:nucleotidyltransferase domain-containing protein [Candidatus Micrarchaeota archaeon]